MKLISSTEFILEQSEKYLKGFIALNEYHSITLNYANFLKKPLTLGMFIPVDEEGNVLLGKPLSPAKDSEWIRWENEEIEYSKAKSKVLFEGFEFVRKLNNIDSYRFNYKMTLFNINLNKTISDLIWADLTLTETAIKMIYG